MRLSRDASVARIGETLELLRAVEEQLHTLLTWGDLTDDERERLTRASNSAEWTLFRVRGNSADEMCLTPGIAKGF